MKKELGVHLEPARLGAKSAIGEGGGAAEGDLSATLDALSDAFQPVFDEQRTTWEREGPAVMASLAATGAKLDWIGGNCPVQAEGGIDGQRFYFRARGDGWQFHVAETNALIFGEPTFYIDRDYGDWPDAGWMPDHEAVGFIVQAIGEFRAAQSIETPAPPSERSDEDGPEQDEPKEAGQ